MSALVRAFGSSAHSPRGVCAMYLCSFVLYISAGPLDYYLVLVPYSVHKLSHRTAEKCRYLFGMGWGGGGGVIFHLKHITFTLFNICHLFAFFCCWFFFSFMKNKWNLIYEMKILNIESLIHTGMLFSSLSFHHLLKYGMPPAPHIFYFLGWVTTLVIQWCIHISDQLPTMSHFNINFCII